MQAKTAAVCDAVLAVAWELHPQAPRRPVLPLTPPAAAAADRPTAPWQTVSSWAAAAGGWAAAGAKQRQGDGAD